MNILHDGNEIPPSGPVPDYSSGYGIVPIAGWPAAEAPAFPLYLQWQDEGVDLGDRGVRVVNILTGNTYSVTRGVGEQSNVITIGPADPGTSYAIDRVSLVDASAGSKPAIGLLNYFTIAGVPQYSAHSDIGPDVIGTANTVQTGGIGIISVPAESLSTLGISGVLGPHWRIESKARRSVNGGNIFELRNVGGTRYVIIHAYPAGNLTATNGFQAAISGGTGSWEGTPNSDTGSVSSTENVLNVWHYYAAQWDGSKLKFYLDGVYYGYFGTSSDWVGADFSVYSAGGQANGSFVGDIDWIAFNPDVPFADLYGNTYTPVDPYPSWA